MLLILNMLWNSSKPVFVHPDLSWPIYSSDFVLICSGFLCFFFFLPCWTLTVYSIIRGGHLLGSLMFLLGDVLLGTGFGCWVSADSCN